MDRRQRGILVAVIIVAVVAASVIGAFLLSEDYVSTGGELHVIYLEGQMITGQVPGGLGFASSTSIAEDIRNSADSGAEAIVLRVNSPGGTPAAAQEIVDALSYARSKDVPVVTSMGDIGASAAYYSATETDLIVANPDTMTGSIGVIWIFENSSARFRSEGTNYTIVKSGEFKDMGYPQTGLNDEEEAYAQEVVDEAFDRFVAQVAEGRNMSVEDVRGISDGRIYTGARAQELGLVDRMGSMETAIDAAEELAGEGDLRVKEVNRPSIARLLFGGSGDASSERDPLSYLEPYGKLFSVAR